MEEYHYVPDLHTCPKCGKEYDFTSRIMQNSYNTHVSKCEGIKKCPKCGKEYGSATKTQKNAYNAHVTRCNGFFRGNKKR